jgi:predicted nicotinamide N-methyase
LTAPILDRGGFVLANTRLRAVPHAPEIKLHLADEAVPLWQATEEELAERGLPPPFWAFAWAGGQALARHVLDHSRLVAGKAVGDFAAGSGLAGIAAMKAGAASAVGWDIDAFAADAIALNAAANGVAMSAEIADVIGAPLPGIEVLLVGDVFYDRDLAARLMDWLISLRASGVDVLIGDPGRSYLPRERLTEIAVYQVPVTRDLEDAEIKVTRVWRIAH